MKYPLFRLGHFPEWFLRRKLYLDFSGRQQPKYRVPEKVVIPEERLRPPIPELASVQIELAGAGSHGVTNAH